MEGNATKALAFGAMLDRRQRARTEALAATARGELTISLGDVVLSLVAALSAATLFLEPRYPAMAALVAALAVQALLAARTNRRLDALAALASEPAATVSGDQP